MSLRPRISLLTLLVLTALVAGGVKLWYGPHRLVEAHGEYSYTRGWDREQVIQGTRVSRSFSNSNELHSIVITYYRNGKPLQVRFYLCTRRPGEKPLNWPWYLKSLTKAQNPMSEEESRIFHEVVEQEKQKVRDLGWEVDGGFSEYLHDIQGVEEAISVLIRNMSPVIQTEN